MWIFFIINFNRDRKLVKTNLITKDQKLVFSEKNRE